PHWGARSTCHGKVSCLYLTASPQGCPKARLWDHFSLPFTPPRWALSSARMVFPTTFMPMILNCFCLSLLRTPLSRRGSRTDLLIYPHGYNKKKNKKKIKKKSPPSAEPGQNGTDGLSSQT